MATTGRNKKLENLVEQKILEFFGDPDKGFELKSEFVAKLKSRLKGKQKTFSLSAVAKKYGLR